MYIHSNVPYPGTLGPASSRNSDIPVTENTHHMCLYLIAGKVIGGNSG